MSDLRRDAEIEMRRSGQVRGGDVVAEMFAVWVYTEMYGYETTPRGIFPSRADAERLARTFRSQSSSGFVKPVEVEVPKWEAPGGVQDHVTGV